MLIYTRHSECDNEDRGGNMHIVPSVSVQEVTLGIWPRKRQQMKEGPRCYKNEVHS